MVGFSDILAQRRRHGWRYVDYESLKQAIGSPAEFYGLLCREIEEVDVAFSALIRQFEAAYPGCQAFGATELRELATLNYLAVLKISKKHDKWVRRAVSQGMAASEVSQEIEAILFRSGFCCSLLSSTLFQREAQPQPPDDFVVWEKLVEVARPPKRAPPCLPPVIEEDSSMEDNEIAQTDCCPICIEPIIDQAVLPCAHRFCWTCLASCAAHGLEVCPLCRAAHSLDPVNAAVDSVLGVLAQHYYPESRLNSRENRNLNWKEVRYELAPVSMGSTKLRLRTPPGSPPSVPPTQTTAEGCD